MTPLTWFQIAAPIVLMIALLGWDIYYTRRWTEMMRRSLERERDQILQEIIQRAGKPPK